MVRTGEEEEDSEAPEEVLGEEAEVQDRLKMELDVEGVEVGEVPQEEEVVPAAPRSHSTRPPTRRPAEDEGEDPSRGGRKASSLSMEMMIFLKSVSSTKSQCRPHQTR